MKTYVCKNRLLEKKNLHQIQALLLRMKDNAIKNPVYLNKTMKAPDFISEASKNAIELKGYFMAVDIKVACAFADKKVLRFSAVFENKRNNRDRLSIAWRAIAGVLEEMLSPLEASAKELKNCLYYDTFKDLIKKSRKKKELKYFTE